MRRLGFFVCFVTTLGLASKLYAATFNVDTTADNAALMACNDATPNDCSLRGAIIAANTAADADIINLQATTYQLTIPVGAETGGGVDATLGDLDILQPVTINGDATSGSTIDVNGTVISDRGFGVSPLGTAIAVTLNNLTIENGRPQAGFGGGGIANGGNLTLSNCVIQNNTTSGTSRGGGLLNAGTAALTITGSTISGNTAGTQGGGGVQVDSGTVTITNSTISGNHTSNGDPAIVPATPGGTAGCGGGVRIDAGTVTIEGSTINGNITGNGGFAVAFIGGLGGSGGGLCVTGGTATLNNNTIASNTTGDGGGGIPGGSGGSGGGISVTTGTLTLNNNTMTGNTTGIGGAGGGGTGGSGGGIARISGTVNIKNLIVALNTVGTGGIGPNCNGSITSQGFNLIGDNTGCTFSGTDGVNGDDVGTGGSPVDPLFAAAGLANNGGPTKTIALQSTSPALDAGNNATCEATDQRGGARPVAGPGVCDKGAFELDICGDGALETGEVCDDGNTDNTDACLNTCVAASCGDGFPQAGVEACDDGNTTAGDGCSATCQTESTGGGGDGSGGTGGDGGTSSTCGDGILDSGETCDDGNTTAGDGCSATCATETENDLSCANPGINFNNLTEGRSISIAAPDSSCGGPALVLDKLQNLPATCTCAWIINPTARGNFVDANACNTSFTPGPAGTGQLSVDVDCGGVTGTFQQSLVVNARPASGSGGCSLIR